MPDFKNFSITRNGDVTVAVPRYTITCDVVNSSTGQPIRSYNVNFPNILANLDDEKIDELFEEFIVMIIRKKIEHNIS